MTIRSLARSSRLEGWEQRLDNVIAFHDAEPFAYGKSDCYMLAHEAVEALSGIAPYKVRYTSKRGAARALAKRGHRNLAEAFAAILPVIPPSLAGRGDIVAVETDTHEIALTICDGRELIGKAETGLIRLPLSRGVEAYRV